MGTWTSDLATGTQVWDRHQLELFGVPLDTRPSRELFTSLVIPEDRPLVDWQVADQKPGARHLSQFRIRRPDGQVRWIAASSVVRSGPSGEPVELVGINWDITQEKSTEAELMAAEHRLSLATQAAEIGIWDWNVETGTFFYSERARQIYGFSEDETITFERLRDRTNPDDYKQVEPALNRALDPKRRSRETYRYRITRDDTGEERWLLAHGGAVFSSDTAEASPLRYTGTLQDITEDVRLEDELRDERARLELALSASEMALWELNLRTGSVTHSPALNRLYGFPEDATPSYLEFASRYAPGETERLEAEAAEAIGRGETSIRAQARQLWPDGTTKWVAVRARIFNGEDGTPARVIGVAMDETARRHWEDTLVTTAAELQHRVKNTLAVVQSVARQTFGPQSVNDEKVQAYFGRLRSLAAATDLITRNNWITVPLGELVKEITSPFDSEGRFLVSGNGGTIESRDVANLSMCLHELCTNAVKYGSLSNDTGRVAIEWFTQREAIVVRWQETGGPPVRTPVRAGFGSKLLQSEMFSAGGGIELDYLPLGLIATIRLKSGMSPAAE